MQNKSSVAVGISGGIDSAMTAYLLKEQGYRVMGLTMKTWDENTEMGKTVKSGCFGPGQEESIISAAHLCQKMGIEHYVISLEREFQQNVMDYFCRTYIQGKTPNPCLVCNAKLKFALLPEKAKAMGLEFDYFATGHYAKIGFNNTLKRYQIRKAKDANKDQSYFLAFLYQEQL
ncbi:MAG: tRNA 2-thiouridine(34) synthase MnmA, partial [Tissierellia bacterium]|nr:tRNA 2-thiouridine(34) synthase MnmA [Tissierellia bacterium]